LLAISKVGAEGGIRSSTFWSSGPKRPASMTNSTASTELSVDVTARFSERLSAELWRVWKPGVSTKMYCASSIVLMPVMRWRVVCALRDVMLIFCPTSAFISVDLPTFGRPTIATMPQRKPEDEEERGAFMVG
jgi:hypothetical protein